MAILPTSLPTDNLGSGHIEHTKIVHNTVNQLSSATTGAVTKDVYEELLATVSDLQNHLNETVSSLQSQLDSLNNNGPVQTTVVTAETGNASVTINWTAAAGATGYTVSGDPMTTGNAVTSVTKTSSQLTHTFTGLTNGVTYRFTVVIAPSGAQKTVTAIPTGAAAAITLSKDESVPGQVTIFWTGAADATGYLVGRNGTDANGYGAWSITDPTSARSRTFMALVPATPYTFSVTPLPGGAAVTIVGTPTSGTVTPPPTPPAGTGTVWLSGAGDDNASQTAGGSFGTWRGEPATYARCWADASQAAMSGMDMMFPYKNANWTGILDIANGGPRDGQTWATAATGSMDSMWRGQCQKIHANWWTNLKGVHLSMAHEMSGNWYPWSVNSGNVANFKTAWRRWHTIVQEELVSKGRNVKIVMSYNFDTVANVSVPTIDPGAAYYDVVGVDFYNMWWGGSAASGLNDQTTWNNNLNAMSGSSPKGIGSWFTYANSVGKPLSIPEWGLSPQAYVDSPFFITTFRNYLATKAPSDPYNPSAGKLAGDAYFNTWPQCRLYPSTSVPNAAAAYRTAKWGAV